MPRPAEIVNGDIPDADKLMDWLEYLEGHALAARKNLIINGDMQLWQRSVGDANACASGVYRADRWKYYKYAGGGDAFNLSYSRSTDNPGAAYGFNYSIKLDIVTAKTSLHANDAAALWYTIEGVDFKAVHTNWVTVSFWVKSAVTGTYCVALRNSDGTRSYRAEYTISAANTWEKKTVTVQLDQSGTWYTGENQAGLVLLFPVVAGTNWQGTNGVWISGDKWTTASCVNLASATSQPFYLTGVQLEYGRTATAFEHRHAGVNLMLAQRYCYKHYPAVGAGVFGAGHAYSTTQARIAYRFPNAMMKAPTLVTSGTASDYGLSDVGGGYGACNAVPSMSEANVSGGSLAATVSSGLTQWRPYVLYVSNTAAYLLFDAEF